MKKHGKKMIAPAIVTLVILAYFAGIIAAFTLIPGIPAVVKALMILVPLSLAGTMIGVFISRMKEIRSGEEDDLSKY